MWNINGASDQKLVAGTAAYLTQYDIICLVETRARRLRASLLPDHQIFEHPATANGKGGQGLAIAVRRSLAYNSKTWAASHSALWIQLECTNRTEPLFVAACYVPPASQRFTQDDLIQHMSALAATTTAASLLGDVILAGDFNARVGNMATQQGMPRGYTDPRTNRHGEQLISLCDAAELHLCTGAVSGDHNARPTYARRWDARPSRLDHLLVSQGLREAVTHSHVDEIREESDHFPLRASLNIPLQYDVATPCQGQPIHRISWDKSRQAAYQGAVQDPDNVHFAACEASIAAGNLEQAFASLNDGLTAAALSSGLRQRGVRGAKPLTRSQRRSLPYFDAECREALKRHRMMRRNYRGTEEARQAQRAYDSIVRRKKRASERRRMETFVESLRKEPAAFWSDLKKGRNSLPESLQNVQQWADYLSHVADRGLPAGCSLPEVAFPQIQPEDTSPLLDPVTLEEIYGALTKLRNGKACGLSGIPVELLKYTAPPAAEEGQPTTPHRIASLLVALFNEAFRQGIIPDNVNCSLITPIFKKGDQRVTANYRPIAVTEPVLRLYAGILNRRLVDWTEASGARAPSQAGFRPGLSTVHQLFALQHLISKHSHRQQPLYAAFVDLKAAYDTVQRPLLWEALLRLGVPAQMVQAVRSMYDSASVTMNINGRHGQRKESTTGVKQGCPSSPTLFGILLDGLHRHLVSSCPEVGVWLTRGQLIQLLGYADDFVLLSPNSSGLQQLLDAMHSFCAQIGMSINADKTKTMVFGLAPLPQLVWHIQGAALETVDSFTYLGLRFSSDAGALGGLGVRHGRMWGAWGVLEERFRHLDCSDSIYLKLQAYQACVPATGSYGCEVWGFLPGNAEQRRQRQLIGKAHVRLLRRVAGLRSTASEAVLLRELQARSLQHSWLLRTIKWWNSIAALPDGALHKDIMLDNCADAVQRRAKNWAWGFITALRKVGYTLTLEGNMLPAIAEPHIQQLLDTETETAWRGIDPCPRTCSSIGADACAYHRWFAQPEATSLTTASLLHISVSPRALQTLLRFRTRCHRLPIVQGRLTGTTRAQRHCTACNAHRVGDEKHMVFECSGLTALRAEYADLFGASVQTMQQFMWQPAQARVAQFIHSAHKMCAAEAAGTATGESQGPLSP